MLLISPERLANESFVQDVLAPMPDRIALLVIDEAHCISDWGHDFRPDYRRIERIIGTLPPNLRLLGTTATANDRVLEDLRDMLGSRLTVQRGGLARPTLLLQTMRLPNQAQRLAWLAERLREVAGSGIIYTLTVRDAERVAAWLQSRGFAVEAYTGQTGDRRPEFEQALLDNRVKALAATTALGMGFDKPDLAFVFHYQAPGSVIHYYQQVGPGWSGAGCGLRRAAERCGRHGHHQLLHSYRVSDQSRGRGGARGSGRSTRRPHGSGAYAPCEYRPGSHQEHAQTAFA